MTCYNCNQTGHSSRDCPKAKTVAAVGLEEPLIIAHFEVAGFATAKRAAPARPAPTPAPLGNYMQGNSFSSLVGDRSFGLFTFSETKI